MKKRSDYTEVVFRTFKDDGQTIALFPYIYNSGYNYCLSYMHIGQHSGADYAGVMKITRSAKTLEYWDLWWELSNIGYGLCIIPRINWEKQRVEFSKQRR